MNFNIITLFPEYFNGALNCGIIRIARKKKLVSVTFTNPRDFAEGGYVDDYMFGGGAGMVMQPEPLVRAIANAQKKLKTAAGAPALIDLTPKGRLLDQNMVKKLVTKNENYILICGRYKGIDARINGMFDLVHISVGDYILAGGETAALTVIEAVTRLLPGVLGNKDSAETDSLHNGLLEAPIYTRPCVFRKLEVPQVLRNGNHRAIAGWRRKESLRLTLARRPDLIPANKYTKNDLGILLEVINGKDS
jgi:tRNA (guanine37-N1)-methyltransferase